MVAQVCGVQEEHLKASLTKTQTGSFAHNKQRRRRFLEMKQHSESSQTNSTTARKVGSRDFERVRVTSFDNHRLILPSVKRKNDHNQLFSINPPGLLLDAKM